MPHRDQQPGEVNIAIRPEAIHLANGHGATGLDAQVRKATYLGSHMEYTVDCALGELFVIDPRVSAPIAAGTAVSASFADHGVTIVRPAP